MQARPTSRLLAINYVVTLGILGAIVYLSQGKPTVYYYSPVYNDHQGPGYDAPDCRACHSAPFRRVENTDCTNSLCHQSYQPDYTGWDRRIVYDAEWVSLRNGEAAPQYTAARRQAASVAFHHLPAMRELSCTACHKTHTPPPDGRPLTFPHRPSPVVPEGVALNQCASCHGPNQAPPIHAHAELLAAGGGECFQCHLGAADWRDQVQWPGGPAGEGIDWARLRIEAPAH